MILSAVKRSEGEEEEPRLSAEATSCLALKFEVVGCNRKKEEKTEMSVPE